MKVEFTPVTDYAASVEGLINHKLDMVWFGGFTFVQANARSKGKVVPLVQRAEDEKVAERHDGEQVPLESLAQIELLEGASQIKREMAKRRIVIGINVRDRDLGGYVAELQKMVRKEIELPSGYYYEWGGQFQNMERALGHLSIIVPITPTNAPMDWDWTNPQKDSGAYRRGDGRVVLRSPLANALATPELPGLAAVVVVLLGSTAFDGLSRTVFWQTSMMSSRTALVS